MRGFIEKFTEDFPSSYPTMRVSSITRIRTAQVSVRPRWKFRHVALCVQIILASMLSFSLPVVRGLARTITTMKGTNNLSPLEDLCLRSRLEGIKTGIQKNYSKIDTRSQQTFIFPGAGGVDDLVLELQASNPNSKIIDWKEYRGSILTASFDSEAVGEAVAELVLDTIETNATPSSPSLSSIRFIGISVGAFAANAAATLVHNDDCCDSLDVHLVLLDPFCGRGAFGPNYGRDNFGKHATTALQILNTDDPVPSTNDSLPLCYCIDVTDAPQKKDFVLLPGDSMHSWPLAYYIRHYSDDNDDTDHPNSESSILPRGKVIKIS